VQRAIEHEFERQVVLVENGEYIEQNTLNFNADTGETSVLRSKEMANDYRYFPEPDLTPLVLTRDYLEKIRSAMPALPNELFNKYINQLGLSDYDAGVITADKDVVLYFEELIKCTENYKAAVNWLMGPVKSYINESGKSICDFAIRPKGLAEMIGLIDSGKINYSLATQKLFPAMLKETGKSAQQMALQLNLLISPDTIDVSGFIKAALAKYPDKVIEYQNGKKGVLGLFMGEIMKSSKGKIDPQATNQLLIKELEAK
jgi:aspartyl-tRNA(Asn)/glutamyl-tRNA(Gln) amidotransferase subunit B